MTPERHGREQGFTLLEILVAISLTALLVYAAQRSFFELTHAQESKLEERGRDRIAELALDRMERELVGTVLLVRPEDLPPERYPWVFQGIDGIFEAENADAVRFVSETAARSRGGIPDDGLRLVTYGTRVDDETGHLSLYRQLEPLPERPTLDPPVFDGAPIVRDVAEFSVRFVDEETGQPVEEWDSRGEQGNRLPGEVEVALRLNDRDEDGKELRGARFERRVPLVVRPIGGEDEEEGSECGDRPALQECIQRFQASLVQLQPEDLEAIEAGLRSVSTQCFNPNENPEVEALAELLRDLTGLDPNEVCS